MGLFGAKDMSGYWPAGRGAIIPQLTQPKNFCTTRLFFQNRSFVEFTEKNEHHGGDLDENGSFPSRKCVLL